MVDNRIPPRTLWNDILGKGWAFPFRFSSTGRTNRLLGAKPAESIEKVKMALQQILGTRIGSRVIDRGFGSDTKGVVFEPIDQLTANRLRSAIMESIQIWERRVEILSIEVDMTRAQEGVLEAHIDFRIISTQTIGNLVYPFYITPDMRATNVIEVGAP